MSFKEELDYHLFDLWISTHPLESMRPQLRDMGYLSAKELLGAANGERVKVAGMLIMIHTPPTRSGRRVMFITLEDETGLIDLVAFEDVQKRWARAFLLSELLAIEGILKREGRSKRAISIVIRRVLDLRSS